MSVEKYGLAIRKSLFALTNQDSAFSRTRENSKIFNITSKYFRFFHNKPHASWVAHITRDFLTCYSCLYYSFVLWQTKLKRPNNHPILKVNDFILLKEDELRIKWRKRKIWNYHTVMIVCYGMWNFSSDRN